MALKLSTNIKLSAGIIILVVLWLLSGIFFGDSDAETTVTKETATETAPAVTVETTHLQPQLYTQTVTLIGKSEPLTLARISAQTAGTVKKLLVDRGSVVRKDQSLLTIDIADRNIRLKAAEADLKAQQAQTKAAQKLFEEGFTAETRLAEQEAALAGAERTLADIKLDITYTDVKSPLEGVVEDRMVDIGDYVNVGTSLFEVVGRDAFLLVGYAAQQDREFIQPNLVAQAKLANGQTISGTVRFIATHAEEDTKTYRIEVLVDGNQFQIPTGMTATIELPIVQKKAYLIAHALLVLDEDGHVGVMLNNPAESVAKFVPVTPLADTPQGVWVDGLPETGVHIISRGQGFVKDGTKVKVKEEPEANAS